MTSKMTYKIEMLIETSVEAYQATLKDENDKTEVATLWKDNWRDLAEGKYVYGNIINSTLRPGHRSIGYAETSKELA